MNEKLDLKPAAIMAQTTIPTSNASSCELVSHVDSSSNSDDFIADSTFDVRALLHKLLYEDTLIPDNLPDVPKNFRLQTRNRTFVSNFVSLCIWKHIHNDDTWCKPSDLDVTKNPENVRVFNHHAKVMKTKYHDEFWVRMTALKIKDLFPERIFHYSKNVRTEILKGLWYDKNPQTDGLYYKFRFLLDAIGFKMLKSEHVDPKVLYNPAAF